MTRMTAHRTAQASAILFALSYGAYAQDTGTATDHAGHDMSQTAQPATDASPSTTAYQEAAAAMHRDMSITYSGNADVDFVRGMIAHHQGAIAMAQVELNHGQDPEIRKLAKAIISAQQTEIATMEAWLAKNQNQ